jgi:DNA replication and repair protein RecF
MDIRLDGARPKGLSVLAQLFPVQAFHPESVSLVYGEAALRRAWLDWGLFHVEQSYIEVWRTFRDALDQRNKLLKQGSLSPRELRVWDQQFMGASGRIDELRQTYLRRANVHLQAALKRIGELPEIFLSYTPGWPEGETLADALLAHLEQDRERGFTSVGPQRADVRVRVSGGLARDMLSRGECKTLSYAMLLAQLFPLVHEEGRRCLLLVDDIASELDGPHRARLFKALKELGQQMIVTSLALEGMDDGLGDEKEVGVFHVEHAKLEKCDVPNPLNHLTEWACDGT